MAGVVHSDGSATQAAHGGNGMGSLRHCRVELRNDRHLSPRLTGRVSQTYVSVSRSGTFCTDSRPGWPPATSGGIAGPLSVTADAGLCRPRVYMSNPASREEVSLAIAATTEL